MEKAKPLAERTAEKLVQLIMDKKYAPGQKIPTEPELTVLLQAGRNTVREAVRALVSRNVLEIRRGDGTYVAERPGVVEDPFGIAFVADKEKTFLDLLEVRFMLEPDIAALAAQNATEEDIARLGELCTEVEEALKQKRSPINSDIEFHTQIARCSKNSVVQKLVPIINAAITACTMVKAHTIPGATISHHREIFTAIKEHRAYDASDAMLLHLAYNRNKVKKSICSK